ncbi:MAG TPA: RHS repeat domain-containing protein, partial [Noviherbaspirillum sp.]
MVNEKKIRRGTFRSLAKAAVLILAFASPAFAALERYDYDAIGRLIRVIDEKDRVTEYTYDAVGNILKVDTGGTGSALVPVISGISPSALRRGEAKTV